MKLVFFNDEFNGVYSFAKKPLNGTIYNINRIFDKFLQVNINK